MGSTSDSYARLLGRIEKIRALAEQGIDGERDTAQAMLDNLLRKHGLSLEDVDQRHARDFVPFSFSDAHEKMLLNQIVRMVRQRNDLTVMGRPSEPSTDYYELSALEKLEVTLTYEILRKKLAETLSIAVEAFIFKHELLAPCDEATEQDAPLTQEEKNRAERIISMMDVVERTPVRTAVTFSNPS